MTVYHTQSHPFVITSAPGTSEVTVTCGDDDTLIYVPLSQMLTVCAEFLSRDNIHGVRRRSILHECRKIHTLIRKEHALIT